MDKMKPMGRPSNEIANSPGISELDAIDLRLLQLLQQDARMSNKELAAAVGLSQSACLRRVQRLVEQGAVRAFRASVAPSALGVGLQAMISVRLKVHAREAFTAIREHVRTLPEVVAVYSLGGQDDLLLHVAVRDATHLRDLTIDGLASQPEVAHMQTAVIFDYERLGMPTLSVLGPDT